MMKRSVLLGFVGALMVTGPAWAQLSLPGQSQRAVSTKPKPREETPAPPPALPGARAEPTAVAPAARDAADLPPTEALFDAINRGDLATVKDSINRGADITGRNVLGLTPLELSVDLGRNQISFLLLSLRGSNGFATSRGPGAAPKPPSAAERREAARAEQAVRGARERSARALPAQPAAPRTARLFAGDGGAPVPQAGFFGFGVNR